MSSPTSALRITLIGLFALAIAMGIGRFAFTPLLPMMQRDGLLSITGGGVLAAVHFLGYWLGAVFAVRLSNAPKLTLRLSLVAIGISTLGMGLTDDLVPWLVFRWLSGVFSATTLVLVGSYYVKHLTEIRRPQAQGWIFSGVGVGIALAGLAALGLMAGGVGSAQSWQIIGTTTLIAVLALCLWMGPEIPRRAAAAQSRESQRTPVNWILVLAYGATGFGYIVPATYLPVMAREIVASPLVFGWSWPVFGLAAFASTPLVAVLRRHFPNRRIWFVSQIVMALGLLLPVIQPNIFSIIVAGISVGGTFMIITMMGMMEMHRLVPAHDALRHIAILTAAFASGQIIGPLFSAFLRDLSGSFSPSLVIASAALAVTALALIIPAPKQTENDS